MQLVKWANSRDLDNPGDATVALFDDNRFGAVSMSHLGAWTQLGEDRVIASLTVDGEAVATVPFVFESGGWRLDLVAALELDNRGRP